MWPGISATLVRAKVRRYDPIAATVTTIAGSGTIGFGGDGGDPLSARLNHPRGIASSVSSLIYVADTGNLRVREIDQTPARNLDDFLEKTKNYHKGDTILFLIKRGNSTLYLTLKVDE